jgi:hypothetical protein
VERYFEAGNFAGIQKVCQALPKGYVEEDEHLFMYYEIAKNGAAERALG